MYKRAIREVYDFKPSEYRNAEQKSDTDSDLDAGSESPDSKLDYVTLISVAERYDVPLQHVVPTFIVLVMRDKPLEDAEAAHLSRLTLCRLARARERYLRLTLKLRAIRVSGVSEYNRHSEAERIVREIWLPNTAAKT